MAEKLGSGLQNRVHRCDSGSRLDTFEEKIVTAGMMKLANITDLKSVGRKALRVQVPLPA